ncbi:hypothetical protein BP5796_09367 [Coleophoma crateriformis]|uniref:Integral membrane protein n=1 Tax=Coleophoma crateriformis TaxID=565419 RepID=A0A3D8QY62_9HELO|nr:hypothetical protein BP5796_09367 [Coleophoma crateriformis]
MDLLKNARNKVQSTVNDVNTAADPTQYPNAANQSHPQVQYGSPAMKQYGCPRVPYGSQLPQQQDGNHHRPVQLHGSPPQSHYRYASAPQVNYGQCQQPPQQYLYQPRQSVFPSGVSIYHQTPLHGSSQQTQSPSREVPQPGKNYQPAPRVHPMHAEYTHKQLPTPVLDTHERFQHLSPPPPLTSRRPYAQQFPQYQQQAYQSPSVTLPDLASLSLSSKCIGKEPRLIDYVQFYVLKPEVLRGSYVKPLDDDEVTLCESCFLSKIAPNPGIASSFRALEKKPTDPSDSGPEISYDQLVCTFRLPSILSLFNKQCIPRNTITPIVEYLLSPDWSPCTGSEWVESTGQTYYSAKGQGIDNFGCCETCFKLYLRFTSFEGYFNPMSDPPNPNALWGCSFGVHPYTEQVVRTELLKRSPDFRYLVSEIRERIEIPPCPGEGNAIAPGGAEDTYFYEAEPGKSGIFCRECYFDCIRGTVFKHTLGNYVQMTHEQKGTVACDLSSSFSKIAMEVAARANDDEIWRSVMSTRTKVPRCVGISGLDEADFENQEQEHGSLDDWYCFKDFANVEICPNCYWTTINLVGAKHLFTPITRPLRPGVIRMCFLTAAADPSADVGDPNNFENTLAWRGQMLRATLNYGYNAGENFTPTLAAASKISKLPPPCGSIFRNFKEPNGRKWLGRVPAISHEDPNDCQVFLCEECHQNIVQGSLLEPELSRDLTAATHHITDGVGCMAASKRAKNELRDACQKGDLAAFAHYRAKRLEVFKRKMSLNAEMNRHANMQRKGMAVLDMENAQMGTQILMNNNAAMNTTITGIGGSVAQASSNNLYQVGYTSGSIGVSGIMGTMTSMQSRALALLEQGKVLQAEWAAIQ